MSLTAFDLLALSCDSLRSNPLRSALTTVGVFMGVAAVSATLQVGNIGTAVIEKRLAEREAPQVTVMPGWNRVTRRRVRLRLEDLEFLQQRMVNFQAISTGAWFGHAQLIFQDRQATVGIDAVSLDYLLTSGRSMVRGRFFNAADFANFRPVAAIDRFLARELFPDVNPINQRIYAEGRAYVVVGVTDTKLRFEGEEPSGKMLIPLSLRTALTGRRNIGWIQIRPHNLEDVTDLERQAQQLLQQRFPKERFFAWNNAEDILEQRQTLELVSQALAVVGAIALLVGGVGIANITIAAVMERTPEIGLRLAIGATRRDILCQFILEAALLSLVGGAAAIASVHGVTIVVAERFELPYEFDIGIASLSLGSAIAVGVGAGFLPALQASQLDPVKALRSQ